MIYTFEISYILHVQLSYSKYLEQIPSKNLLLAYVFISTLCNSHAH